VVVVVVVVVVTSLQVHNDNDVMMMIMTDGGLQVEMLVGEDTALVSRLLAHDDDISLTSALRASLLSGSVQPQKFLALLDQALNELEERLPPLLEVNPANQELLTIQQRLRLMHQVTTDFIK